MVEVARLPPDLAPVGQQQSIGLAIGDLEPLIGIDPKDPVAACVFQREVACGREIVAPSEVMQLNGEPARDLDRVIARTGVNENDLVDVSDKRSQAARYECRFITNNQGR